MVERCPPHGLVLVVETRSCVCVCIEGVGSAGYTLEEKDSRMYRNVA